MKTKHYDCPDCGTPVETMVPTKSMVSKKGYWDSAVLCPHCETLHFKKVWPGGKCEIFKLEDEDTAWVGQ